MVGREQQRPRKLERRGRQLLCYGEQSGDATQIGRGNREVELARTEVDFCPYRCVGDGRVELDARAAATGRSERALGRERRVGGAAGRVYGACAARIGAQLERRDGDGQVIAIRQAQQDFEVGERCDLDYRRQTLGQLGRLLRRRRRKQRPIRFARGVLFEQHGDIAATRAS